MSQSECWDDGTVNHAALSIRDDLDDLRAGFEFWKAQKVASMELTTLDEMFIRWVDHGRAA